MTDSDEPLGMDMHQETADKLFSVIFPMVFGVKTTAKHNGMDMGMEVHFTPPSIETADIPDVCS